jgi:hypothetical protein
MSLQYKHFYLSEIEIVSIRIAVPNTKEPEFARFFKDKFKNEWHAR